MKNVVIRFKKVRSVVIAVLLIMLAFSSQVTAQQSVTGEVSKTYQVTLNDGSILSGKLISSSPTEIVIQSGAMGEVRIQKDKIKSMVEVTSINEKASGIWFPNPNPSKYLLGNSAIPMEKKTGYYQNTWIFVSSASYAFTRNFSVSGGFEILSIMAGEDGPYAFYLNPKVSFKIANNFYAGGNILYANTIRTVEEFGGLATMNGFFTYGNKNNNVTAAVGWGWADGEFSSRPVLIVSGMTRVSKRIGFVSENWIIPKNNDEDVMSYYGIYSYGIRFLGEKISVDLAFLNNADIAKEIIIGIPWLDFVFNF
jgi:hypothetical protein